MIRRGAIVASLVIMACRGENADEVSYRWPEEIGYRFDYVAQAQADGRPIAKYAESKTARLRRRDGQYLGVFDSVLKTNERPGEPLMLVAYLPEDTLAFYATLGPQGDLRAVSLGCDPAVPACGDALPSAVLLQLRRLVPRLPDRAVPPGTGWVDTLSFDDAARPRGTRGTVVTTYLGRRDTSISGRDYWLVGWRSERRAYRRAGASPTLGAEPPQAEEGMTFVDKELGVPAYSTWAGVALAPPELRARGAVASGFRGRAYLAGSAFDSAFARELVP